ncbi:MAG: hypothetical protein IPO63_17775, partial [Bacteroidetes bacterium]|nr:hypothetical protein [Bacteroidota bacterium]
DRVIRASQIVFANNTDGCEINLLTNNKCGACGIICTGGQVCVNGVCN